MMDNQEREAVYSGISIIIDKSHRNAKNKGFWDNERNNAEMIALMHSELSEALEILRQNKAFGDKKNDLAEEFADVIIRIADFCGGRNINLAQALLFKMEYNTLLTKMGYNATNGKIF